MATIFAAFGKSVGNNKGSVQNFGIVGVTIASEELTKFIFFYCPCDYPDNKLYGTTFIWGPAIILFIVGYLVNRRTWRLTTGLCNRTQGVGKGGKRIFHFIFIFIQIGVKAIIAPATWVVLAFLKGDYYACARWPNPHNYAVRTYYSLAPGNTSMPLPCEYNPNPIKFSVAKEAEIIARNLRAESHVIGWFYLSIGMFLGVICMFAFRCRSKYSYEQSNYIDRYRKSEVELFEDALDKKAEEQAKRIVDGYFSKPRSKEEWDQIAVINDKVTRSKRGRAIYSPLHKFVNKELRAAEDAKDLDLVSDAAMKIKRLLPMKKKKTASNNAKKKTGGSAAAPPSSNSGGGGAAAAAIPMVAMASLGKQKTVVKMQQPPIPQKHPEEKKVAELKPPPEQKEKDQQKPEGTAPPVAPATDPAVLPSVNPFVPDVKVVDPAKSPQGVNGSSVPPAIPPPPKKQEVAPPVEDRPAPPLPTEEVAPAVRETSLGDFGGAYSREDLRNLSDDDEDPVPVGDKVILFEDEEEEEEDGDAGEVQYQPVQEADVVVHAGDEEPLISEED